jgi:hypothetical protein
LALNVRREGKNNMMTLKVKDKEYKVRFTYNSFADSDLLDRTFETLTLVQDMLSANDNTNSVDTLMKLFTLVRELLFVGFKRENPVESKEAIGDILDDYLDEDPENHGLIDVFNMIAGEFLASGFFGDLLTKSNKEVETLTKKSAKKK